MNLTLTRGDTYVLTFSLIDNDGNPYILAENDKCYFTVKTSYQKENYVLQKRLNEGITYNAINSEYEIKLNSIDTNSVEMGSYVYDLKVKVNNDEVVKTLIKANINFTNNATHKGNE